MFRRFAALLTLLTLTLAPIAQDSGAISTLDALASVEIPPRDRVQLAREILGIEAGEHTPAPTEYALGDRRTFFVRDLTANTVSEITAELMALGEHIAVWVDVRGQRSREAAAGLAAAFDDEIYPAVRNLFGSERTPGIDGDPHVVALFAFDVSGIVAYYASEHSLPRSVVPFSNEAEMFIFNLNATGSQIDVPGVLSTTAHEFQHMVRDNLDSNAQTWLNEGLSIFTEWLLGYDRVDAAFSAFLSRPATQLNAWSLEAGTQAHYGAAGLFATYIFERFGKEGIAALSEADGLDMALVENALHAVGADIDTSTLFADFAAANWLQDPSQDARWGYPNVDLGEPVSRVIGASLPATLEGNLPPYSTHYWLLDAVPRGETLRISLSFDGTLPLLPAHPASGEQMFVSVRQDDSAVSLTRSFDLTGVTSAALDYRVWHDLEATYDFGYVLVSDDGGQSWDVIHTSGMSSAVLESSAYGPGYTGQSGGWIDDSIPLDAYAGDDVLVRFVVITDDALNAPGMAIDDVRLDAISYASSLEGESGGWDARGWIRTDNRVPVQVWVQVLQRTSSGVQVDRLSNDGSGTLEAVISPDAESVAIAVSPFAPVTTEAVTYTLTVTADGG